ncbi:hypothetical protein [Nocardia sp. NPDC050435]|uniref:hypothetical protein n=1 Tax=Nocardia sp. NPDC050435 TaxID=3155040 RepID=UPI0033EE9DF7
MNRLSITFTMLLPLAFAAAVVAAPPARADAGPCTGSVCQAPRRIESLQAGLERLAPEAPPDALGSLAAGLSALAAEHGLRPTAVTPLDQLARQVGVPPAEWQPFAAKLDRLTADLGTVTAEAVPLAAGAAARLLTPPPLPDITAALHRLAAELGPILTGLAPLTTDAVKSFIEIARVATELGFAPAELERVAVSLGPVVGGLIRFALESLGQVLSSADPQRAEQPGVSAAVQEGAGHDPQTNAIPKPQRSTSLLLRLSRDSSQPQNAPACAPEGGARRKQSHEPTRCTTNAPAPTAVPGTRCLAADATQPVDPNADCPQSPPPATNICPPPNETAASPAARCTPNAEAIPAQTAQPCSTTSDGPASSHAESCTEKDDSLSTAPDAAADCDGPTVCVLITLTWGAR